MIDRIAAIIPYEKSKNTGPPEIKKKINKKNKNRKKNHTQKKKNKKKKRQIRQKGTGQSTLIF